MRRHGCRVGLHYVVARGPGHTVLVGAVVHYGRASSEIVVWRRSGGGPLQRGCLPGVVTRLRSLEHAPEQIKEEDQLSGDGYDCRVGHKLVQADQGMEIGEFG